MGVLCTTDAIVRVRFRAKLIGVGKMETGPLAASCKLKMFGNFDVFQAPFSLKPRVSFEMSWLMPRGQIELALFHAALNLIRD